MSIIRFGDRQRYTVVANEAIEDSRLSFKARGILLWLLSKPDGWEVRSDAIAAAGGEGRDAVRSGLTELEKAGYLVRSRERDEKGQWRTVSVIFERPNAQVSPAPEIPASGTRPSESQASSSKNEEVITEQQVREQPDGFDQFWAVYPRKTAKQNALKAWKRLTVIERALATGALPKHIAWWNRRGDESFIPHAATWLNGQRFHDTLPGEVSCGGFREPDEVWFDGANVAHRYPESEYK
jgi:ribulose bisphosphate carboxylase small subunit